MYLFGYFVKTILWGDIMKLSRIQLYVYSVIITVGGVSLFAANMAIKNFPTCGYLVFLLILPFVLIFVTFIPREANCIKTILDHNYLRIILLIYLLLSGLFSLSAYIGIVSDYYYQETSHFILLILIILTCLFMSTYGLANIVRIGFVMLLVVLVLYTLTLTSNTTHDCTLLKHTPLKLNNLYNLLCFPFLFLDELLLFLFIPTKKINKFSLILMIVGTIVFSTGLIFECYLFFTPKYFENSKYPYLIKYFAYRNNHYLEHLDILYLICTTAFIIFHFSTQCEIARIIFKGKRNSIITLIFPTVLAIGVIFNYKLNMTKEVASLILMITTIILTLFFILFKFARRKKHATNN